MGDCAFKKESETDRRTERERWEGGGEMGKEMVREGVGDEEVEV